MQQPTIVNVQKFSIHDGDGIRTTVFFKGCPLSCIWCHNPESQRFPSELMYYSERCSHCGACASVCPSGAVDAKIQTDRTRCSACGRCTDYCIQNAREIVGNKLSIDELIRQLTMDTPFYEVSGGGVTLSGGEVLAQDIEAVVSLCSRLKRRGYSIDIDTCGHVPYECLARVLPYTDMFLYDLKHMDPELHRRYTGVDNRLILENLKRLSDDGAPINIRMPLIHDVNDDEEEIEAVLSFLKNIRVQKINLLPYHRTGSDKYERLGRTYEGSDFTAPDAKRMEEIRRRFMEAGYSDVKIGG